MSPGWAIGESPDGVMVSPGWSFGESKGTVLHASYTVTREENLRGNPQEKLCNLNFSDLQCATLCGVFIHWVMNQAWSLNQCPGLSLGESRMETGLYIGLHCDCLQPSNQD